MKKGGIIGLVIFGVLIILGILYINISPKPNPLLINESSVITPSQVYSICTDKSCPSQLVSIQGEMSRSSTTFGMFSLTDGTKTVYIDLSKSNISLIDIILFHEKTFLQKDGIVEVKLKGKIYHDVGMCTNGGCQDMINMILDLNQVEVIQKVGCKDAKSSKTTLESGDCFDVSDREISLADAYNTFFSSKVCTQNSRRPSGYFEYFSNGEIHNGLSQITEGRWAFGVSSPSRHGGCSEWCYVSEGKVIFSEFCAGGSNLIVPEDVSTKSIDMLYAECKEASSVTYEALGPAEDDPIGATREDKDGNIWTKQEDMSWKIEEKNLYGEEICTPSGEGVEDCTYTGNFGLKYTSWGDALIDEQPGGINYKPDLIECDVYLKRTFE